MRKGLKVTLMTVAIAMMGFNAMSMAPVISDMPDMIVGDEASATDPNLFVYPDAIDLDNYVTDDTTADGSIVWSYTKATLPGRYRINGVDPIDLGSENANAPGAKRIDNQVVNSEVNPDANTRTITVRDHTLSPLPSGPNTDPGTVGIVASEVITFIASDGTTYSLDQGGANSVVVYTDNDGVDRLSPGGLQSTPVTAISFTAGTQGWLSAIDFAIGGGVTPSQNGTTGLCIDVTAAGVNQGTWRSSDAPYNFIPLVANAVYRVRLNASTTSSLGGTPLWTFVYEQQATCSGGEYLFLDNEGGENAPSPIGRSTFDLWITPPPVSTTAWNNTTNGPFAAANAGQRDYRLIFKVLDVENVGYGGETDAGAVCVRDIDVVRYAIGDLSGAATATPLDVTSVTDALSGGNSQVDGLLGTNVTFNGGVATVSSSGNTWQSVEVALFRPGDKTVTLPPGSAADSGDNWPVTWEDNTLYQITFNLSAPDANSETNPPDILVVGADTPTNEVLSTNYITTRFALSGMPKQGTPQAFTSFHFGHSLSGTAAPFGKLLRPKLQVICRTDFTDSNNTGSFNVHSYSVKKIGGI
jgi:hypothetical protein